MWKTHDTYSTSLSFASCCAGDDLLRRSLKLVINMYCYFLERIILVNPFMSSRLFYLIILDRYISIFRVSFLLLPCFIENPVFIANSVDPDQRMRSTASDLGLHCLPVSLLWDARHKCVKQKQFYVFKIKLHNKLAVVHVKCYLNRISS